MRLDNLKHLDYKTFTVVNCASVQMEEVAYFNESLTGVIVQTTTPE